MVYRILSISSFIICCVALGINCFALGRMIRLNKELLEELERELSTEETEKEITNLHKGESK